MFNPESLKALRISRNMTQQEFADAVGVARELLNKMEAGKKPISRASQVLISDYLRKVAEGTKSTPITGYIPPEITKAPTGKIPFRPRGASTVPLYDADFEAGKGVAFYEDIRSAQPIYYMDVPDFAGCIAFRNTGRSMEKLIPASSILFATAEEDWQEGIEYGQIFGIVTTNKRKLLKWVRKSLIHPETHFRLISANPEFDEMEMPKNKIKSMWLVHGWINKNT